jgi:hypothetical protein
MTSAGLKVCLTPIDRTLQKKKGEKFGIHLKGIFD